MSKIQYTYADKRRQDIITYAYILTAIIIGLAAMALLFPQLVVPEAGSMFTAIYIIAASLIALVLVFPFMKLKKSRGWFIRTGEAVIGSDSVTFTPGATIAYKDIFRILCDDTSDFGRPTQRLRIAYAMGDANATLIKLQAQQAEAYRDRFFGRRQPALPSPNVRDFEERWRQTQLNGPRTKGGTVDAPPVTRQI